MNRLEAIQCVMGCLSGDELIIHANGAIGRESYSCGDRAGNFYLLGSMGLASSVALGVALNRPQRKVLVFDGDGNILMGFGTLAMIGALKPENLLHIVFDNQVYGTTGNQPTLSARVSLSEAARSCGYATSAVVDTLDELSGALISVLKEPGPHFLQVRVSRDVPTTSPRIPYAARDIKERFLRAVGKGSPA